MNFLFQGFHHCHGWDHEYTVPVLRIGKKCIERVQQAEDQGPFSDTYIFSPWCAAGLSFITPIIDLTQLISFYSWKKMWGMTDSGLIITEITHWFKIGVIILNSPNNRYYSKVFVSFVILISVITLNLTDFKVLF